MQPNMAQNTRGRPSNITIMVHLVWLAAPPDVAATPAPIASEVSISRRDLITVTFRIEDSSRILNMLMRVTDVRFDPSCGIQDVCVGNALGIENRYSDCQGWISLNRSGNLAPADGQFFPCYKVKYTILKVELMDDTIAKARRQKQRSHPQEEVAAGR